MKANSPLVVRTFGPAESINEYEEQAHNAVIAMDIDGRISHVNVVARALLGMSSDEVTGCHYGDFLRLLDVSAEADERDDGEDPLERCLKTGQVCVSLSGLLMGADGIPRRIDGVVAPTYNESCDVVGAILMTNLAEAASHGFDGYARHDREEEFGRERYAAYGMEITEVTCR